VAPIQLITLHAEEMLRPLSRHAGTHDLSGRREKMRTGMTREGADPSLITIDAVKLAYVHFGSAANSIGHLSQP
jgi:hypothetical protein